MSVSSKCASSAGLRPAGINSVPTPLGMEIAIALRNAPAPGQPLTWSPLCCLGARPRLSTLRANDSSLLRRPCAAQQRSRARQVRQRAGSEKRDCLRSDLSGAWKRPVRCADTSLYFILVYTLSLGLRCRKQERIPAAAALLLRDILAFAA
jgi:hypothetical protein